MLEITYTFVIFAVATLWFVSRMAVYGLKREIHFLHEIKIVLLFICATVILRVTFFALGLENGSVRPLIIDIDTIYPLRINLLPLVHLFDYNGSLPAILVNVLGNIAMFVPVGILLPIVYPKRKTLCGVLVTGFLCSLCIEIMQLPIAARVSDIDDLILNTLGSLIGYGVYSLYCKAMKK